MLIGEMMNVIANNSIEKNAKQKMQMNDDINDSSFNYSMMPIDSVETKSLNEPLSMAFGLIESVFQLQQDDISVFDTTFCTTYEINDSSKEKGYKTYLVVRDFPDSEEKLIYIRYWNRYNNIIHLDKEWKFSIFTEYIEGYEKIIEAGTYVGDTDVFKTNFNIQADGHFISASNKTKDYNSDVKSIINDFKQVFMIIIYQCMNFY